jgi:broad specificity phosphatase PhoE
LPHCDNDAGEFEASNNFVFDDTIHEGRTEHHPLPSSVPIQAEQQHEQHQPTMTVPQEGGCSESSLTTLDEDQREIIVFLVRHGEAAHNIKEREAKALVKQKSVKEGLAEDDPVTLARMEEARKAVLNDETLRDPPLSDKGREEAQKANEELERVLSEHPQIERPSYVVVSPLTRTLETCDIMFPDHDDIHVRSSIAERHTLKPPDTRSHVSQLSKRDSFRHFSMENLRVESMDNIQEQFSEVPEHTTRSSCSGSGNSVSSKQEVLLMDESTEDFNKYDSPGDLWKEEDKAELRRRTEKIVGLLAEANSTSVAVVTHKGYLRELERGPLGHPEAEEFKNAEIRIYKITVSMTDLKLIKSERMI